MFLGLKLKSNAALHDYISQGMQAMFYAVAGRDKDRICFGYSSTVIE